MDDQVQAIELVRDTSAIVGQQQLGEATTQVQYNSSGHALIIGDTNTALGQALNFKEHGVTIVEIDESITEVTKRLTDDGVAVFTVPALALSGYLGAYKAVVPASSGAVETEFDLAVSVYLESGCFDVVLDLSRQALIAEYLPPFGYRHLASDHGINEVVAELQDMKGEFEKPKYFNYNDSICAHSRSKISGCNRCVDACATGAIVSDGERVSVDPFLCQGCGSCATVCPSGAMTYAYPKPANAIDKARNLLVDNEACVLLLYSEAHKELVNGTTLNKAILPLEVEEVSAFGADFWLSLLAAQACRIVLLTDAGHADPSRQAITAQIGIVRELLAGLDVHEDAVVLVGSEMLASDVALQGSVLDPDSWKESKLKQIVCSAFATHGDKRQTLRLALDALSEQLQPINAAISLSSGAPFGQVSVNKQACTLCMSCVSSCPAKALMDGQDTPALRFVEANCLQCGICESACPESAISLQPQYLWDSVAARKIQTLHHQEPFHCLSCHTPFTTRSMIDAMTSKLSGHWMFDDPKAVRRLKLCADCRVKDIFEDDRQGIDVHKSL